MKARHIILTIAAAALLAAPTTALAQNGPGQGGGYGGGWGGGMGPHRGGPGGFGDSHGLGFFERMLPRVAEELGLSDEQLAEIEAILESAQPTIESYAEQLRAEREAFRAAHQDPTVFDEGAFRSHANAQHDVQTELGVVVGQTKAKLFQVLNEEQLAQLEELRGSFGPRMKRRPGGRRSQ